MGFNLGSMSSMVGGLTNNISLSSLTSGVDISNINPASLGGVKDTIQTNIGNIATQLESNIGGCIENLDFESMMGNLDIEGKVNQMMNQNNLNSTDISSMDMDPSQMFDQSQIESMINEMTSGISDGTGLDSITHM